MAAEIRPDIIRGLAPIQGRESRWVPFQADTTAEETMESIPWPSTAQQRLDDLMAINLTAGNASSGSRLGSSLGGSCSCACNASYTCGSSHDTCSPSCPRCCERLLSRETQRGRAGTEAVRKVALRWDLLRWHPDKFLSRVDRRIPVHQQQQTAVTARVRALVQDLNAIGNRTQI